MTSMTNKHDLLDHTSFWCHILLTKKSKMGNILPHFVPKMLYFSLQNPKIQVVEKMVGCNLGGKNKKT
jgi:hypothetical protein